MTRNKRRHTYREWLAIQHHARIKREARQLNQAIQTESTRQVIRQSNNPTASPFQLIRIEFEPLTVNTKKITRVCIVKKVGLGSVLQCYRQHTKDLTIQIQNYA